MKAELTITFECDQIDNATNLQVAIVAFCRRDARWFSDREYGHGHGHQSGQGSA